MKRKILSLFLLLSLSLTACGNNANDSQVNNEQEILNETKEEMPSMSEIQKEVETFSGNETQEEKEVQIIMSMYSADNTSITDYVQNMNSEEGMEKYQVYDDTHYSFTISDKEREVLLDELKSSEVVNEYFEELFSDEETYNGAFISVEHDSEFKEFSFYVDKQKYDTAGFAASFGPLIISGLLGDAVQAYELIPIEERGVVVKIIDNDTKEILYDSSIE